MIRKIKAINKLYFANLNKTKTVNNAGKSNIHHKG